MSWSVHNAFFDIFGTKFGQIFHFKISPQCFLRPLDHLIMVHCNGSKLANITLFKEIQTLMILALKVPKEALWMALWLYFAALIKMISFRGMAKHWKTGYFSVMSTLDPNIDAICRNVLSKKAALWVFAKALVRSKILSALALALSRKICARAHAQFFQDLALALKTIWAPLNFAPILRFWKALDLL